MSMVCALIVMFGQVVSAEDLVSQMQAQDDQIQTLDFRFHLDEVKGPGYFADPKKIERTKTRGRLLFRAPHEVRLERVSDSGDVLEVRVISSDGNQAKHLTVMPETGNSNGLITNAGFEFYLSSFHGISWLFRRPVLEGFRNRFRVAKDQKWRVTSVGELQRMSFTGFHLDVDPARGYWIVAGDTKVPNSKGEIHRVETIEPVEFLPGIWIGKRAEYEQWRNGKVFLKMTAMADLDSVRVNQPIDAKEFELVFPHGTLVENMLTHTTEFIGGRGSRDRKSVEQLAAANNAPAPDAPSKAELVPGASALRVPETSLWSGGTFAILVSSFLVLCGGWFGWQRWGRS